MAWLWVLLLGAIFAHPPAMAYDDPAGRFGIDPPEGWNEEVVGDGAGAIFTPPAGDARIIVLPLELAAEAGMGEFVGAYEEFVKQSQAGLRVELAREANVSVAGRAALEREYRASTDTDTGRILTVFVKEGTLALVVHASVRSEAAFAKYEPVFRQCVATLRVGGAGGGAATGDETRAKLEALDKAFAAGILSREEYERKRAEIEAAAPKIDEATRKKLEALDAARAAGILNDGEYARKKAELLGGRRVEAPPGRAPAATESPTGKDEALPVFTQEKGKVYRHVIGFSLWHPDSWEVKEHDEFLQLIPADAGQTPEGPTELFFVTGEDVADDAITDPADPQVIAYLDEQVRSFLPVMQQTGRPEPVKMAGGKGVILRWQGKNPRGQTIVATAFVCILRGHGVALLAIGFKERIEKRDPELRRIFASFGFGEGERDPALVGRWKLVAVTSITNTSPFETDWSRAQLASKSESTLTFTADGRWERYDKSHLLVGSAGVWLEDNSETTNRGRWNAGGGSLYMVWEDSSWDDFQYQLRRTERGIELRTVKGKRGEVWTKTE